MLGLAVSYIRIKVVRVHSRRILSTALTVKFLFSLTMIALAWPLKDSANGSWQLYSTFGLRCESQNQCNQQEELASTMISFSCGSLPMLAFAGRVAFRTTTQAGCCTAC